ncbi:hypothetical protein [Ancylobacter rudongensis]|uniref:Uncharacterized protein n=1 Tax=Ancylobacter rudongensis TaxID=177413 RepID=A0A1G4UQH9_9HYPH|nr:hypothetical protein [Ancylobacter rudongensis]SCW95774.1 hypothetical protein SAMN05660859_0114 [Ancylobacter rudongensis]
MGIRFEFTVVRPGETRAGYGYADVADAAVRGPVTEGLVINIEKVLRDALEPPGSDVQISSWSVRPVEKSDLVCQGGVLPDILPIILSCRS